MTLPESTCKKHQRCWYVLDCLNGYCKIECPEVFTQYFLLILVSLDWTKVVTRLSQCVFEDIFVPLSSQMVPAQLQNATVLVLKGMDAEHVVGGFTSM